MRLQERRISMESLRSKLGIILLLVSMLLVQPAEAQNNLRMLIMGVDDTAYPQVNVFVSVRDERGRFVSDVQDQAFSLLVDGSPVSKFSIEKKVNETQAVTQLWLFDISDRYPNFNINREVTKEIINSLPPKDYIAIGSETEEFKLLQTFTYNKLQASNVLDNIQLSGNITAFYDSLYAAIDLLKEQPEPRALVFIGNGQESLVSKKKIEDVVEYALQNHVSIFSLGIGNLIYKPQLELLAEKTGGQVFYLPGKEEYKKELKETYLKLTNGVNELRQQYILSFTAPFNKNGSKHDITVGIQYQGWKAEDKSSFIACPGKLKLCLPDFAPPNTVGANSCIRPAVFSPDPPIDKLEMVVDGKSLCLVSAEPYECCLKNNIELGDHTFSFSVQDSGFDQVSLSTKLTVRKEMQVDIDAPDRVVGILPTIPITISINSLNSIFDVNVMVNDQEIKTIKNPISISKTPPYLYVLPIDFPANHFNPGRYTLVVVSKDAFQIVEKTEKSFDVISSSSSPPTAWILLIVVILLVVGFFFLRKKKGAVSSGAYLEELLGRSPGMKWPLGDMVVKLGRKAVENDIPLAGLNASRFMAEISYEDNTHVIRSLRPDNPVIVNGVPVAEVASLHNGDLIQAGESQFRYVTGG
jgi:hypothetical protein